MTSEDKMREALEFYADPTNWVSGDVPGHVYAIEDAGGIAREALKSQPKMEPIGWWDGDGRFTRHETLPQKHSWDVVHPLYIVPPAALHSVEAEKDPEWHKADGSTPVAPVWADQDLMWAWKPARGPKKDGQIIMICIQDLGAPWEYAFIRRPAPPEHKPE